MKHRVSKKAASFCESVIREMTRLCNQHHAVNLAQGFPDFPAPDEIKAGACAAIHADKNQYAITWGAKTFRDAIVRKLKRDTGLEFDPERELTVCCGATEAMIAALLGTLDPGEEVIIFEPFYENYGPDCILSGATPVYVRLHPPEWTFDREELRRAFSPRTKGVIINTPHNPTGKVFSREELEFIGVLAQEHDALIYTDEIYEHIVYDGAAHVYPFSLPELRARTVAISGLSKTYSVTGWRLGYVVAPPDITAGIRRVHDFLTVGAPAPLQEGAVAALDLPRAYYTDLAAKYAARRELLLGELRTAGFKCFPPRGAYYVMTEYPVVRRIVDDVEFSRFLVREIGVAGVPGSSFYRAGAAEAKRMIRFNFAKKDDTLREAGRRLRKLREMA